MIATIKRLLGVKPAPEKLEMPPCEPRNGWHVPGAALTTVKNPADVIATLTTDAQREYVAYSILHHFKYPDGRELTEDEDDARIDQLDGPWCAMSDDELRVAYEAIHDILEFLDPQPKEPVE